MTSGYRDLIRESAARLGHVGADTRHIEGWMRLEHGTLDHLDRNAFDHEVNASIQCVATAGSETSEKLAKSYGL